MNNYILNRDDNVPLAFTGKLIAEKTSYTTLSQRWTELRLYRTNKNQYVYEVVGETNISTEKRRSKVYVSDTLEGLHKHMERRTRAGKPYLTNMAKSLLLDAQIAEAVHGQLVERI